MIRPERPGTRPIVETPLGATGIIVVNIKRLRPPTRGLIREGRCSHLEILNARGVAIAAARLVADIRVHQPSVQYAFSHKTGFFQYTGRTDVLDIAHRTDTEHRRLAQGPGRDLGQKFGHQSLMLPSAGQHIAAIETVRHAAAQRERTADDIVFPAHQHVSALDF